MLLFLSLKVLNKNIPCSYSPEQVNLFILYRTGDIFVKRFKDTNILCGHQIRISTICGQCTYSINSAQILRNYIAHQII